MKKFISLTLAFALLLVSLAVPMAAQAETVAEEAALMWDAKDISIVKGRAPRVKGLLDGTLGFAYYKSGDGVYFAKSTNGGVTFANDVKVAANTTDDVYGRIEVQNPNFVVMDNGNILYTYRCNTFTGDPVNKPWVKYYASIRYKISTDGGATFGEEQIAVEWTNERVDQKHDDSADFGFWEPDPVYIGDTLFLYYADTVTPYPDHKPDENLCYQHISYVVWNGTSFGTPAIAQNGVTHESRDGMSVVTKLSDGTYAMVFESTATGRQDRTFVIKMSRSADGINWSAPVAIAVADNSVEQLSLVGGEAAANCNPYIITLPDGRVAVSYQTTDVYEGLVPNMLANRHGVQVMISNAPITADSQVSTDSFTKIDDKVCEVGANGFSKAACLVYSDGKLMVYYEVGANLNEASATYSDVRMSYMDLSDPTLDGNNIENYHIYNSSPAKTVTAEGGQIKMPTAGGTVNMLYGKTDFVTNTTETPVAGLYTQSNYTAYFASGAKDNWIFDETNGTVKGSGRNMTLINSTADMAAFTSSVKLSSNSKTVWSGVVFHTAPSNNGFRGTSGYIVYIQYSSAGAPILKVEYTNAIANKKTYETKLTGVLPTYADNKNFVAVIKVDCDSEQFHVEVINDETKATTGVLDYDLDITATVAGAAFCPTGQFGFTTNASVTYSDFELSSVSVDETEDFVAANAQNIKASADITIPEDTKIQAGFSFRVQKANGGSPGLEGYALKFTNSSSDFTKTKLLLTRYGTNQSGDECQNLGDIANFDVTPCTDASGIGGSTLRLQILTVNKTLYITVTNVNDASKTLDFTADLTKKVGNYDNYFEGGGFGLFNNAYAAVFANISYEILPLDLSNMDIADYDVYAPDTEKLVAEDGELVSKDAVAKKVILKDTVANDFDADATFRIGNDGNFKGGIIFRANDLGNNADDMIGYSCVLYKTPNNTGNYGRIVLLVYKWAIKPDGTRAYMGTIASKADTTTLNRVYPDAATSSLASAGKMLTLHLKVEGTSVKASWDVLGDDGLVAASSANSLDVSLTKAITEAAAVANFDENAHNTVYNAGALGLSISTKGSIVNFILNDVDTMYTKAGVMGYTAYSSDGTPNVSFNEAGDYATFSKAYQQILLDGISTTEFEVSNIFKSNKNGATNLGFDFGINQATHSGRAFNTTDSTRGSECYRLVLVKNANTSTQLDFYLFKFTGDAQKGYTRSQIKVVSNKNFFASCAGETPAATDFANRRIYFNASLKDGALTATAYLENHPETLITVSYDFAEEVRGTVGFFAGQTGTMSKPVVKVDMDLATVAPDTCENGLVYAAINAGTANVGDTVKAVAIPDKNYFTTNVYYEVNGVKTELDSANGYAFEKTYGKTLLSAKFALYGDFDQSNSIAANDLVAMRGQILNSAEYAKVADCNNDNAINVLDLIRLKKHLVSSGEVTLG